MEGKQKMVVGGSQFFGSRILHREGLYYIEKFSRKIKNLKKIGVGFPI